MVRGQSRNERMCSIWSLSYSMVYVFNFYMGSTRHEFYCMATEKNVKCCITAGKTILASQPPDENHRTRKPGGKVSLSFVLVNPQAFTKHTPHNTTHQYHAHQTLTMHTPHILNTSITHTKHSSRTRNKHSTPSIQPVSQHWGIH